MIIVAINTFVSNELYMFGYNIPCEQAPDI